MLEQSLVAELTWLEENPLLEDLVNRYPELWEDVGKELIVAAGSGRVQRVNDYANLARSSAEVWKTRIQKSRNNPKVIESALPHVVKSRMLLLALDKCFLASAAGKTTGKVRFNLFNGLIIQKLLFERDLVRKPVSLKVFKFWWRFVTQRKLLIPLVQDRGIYCFYSKELLRELRLLVGERRCLEIGAGDGTLARFLANTGVQLTATDDYSWSHSIDYPANVQNMDAKRALAKHQPQVVICSWPPAGNNFERHVFSAKSVELYIVIGSRYEFVSGSWDTYRKQHNFEWKVDDHLSKLVLPPEVNNAVLLFKRISH